MLTNIKKIYMHHTVWARQKSQRIYANVKIVLCLCDKIHQKRRKMYRREERAVDPLSYIPQRLSTTPPGIVVWPPFLCVWQAVGRVLEMMWEERRCATVLDAVNRTQKQAGAASCRSRCQ
jgi:hypothetical protein